MIGREQERYWLAQVLGNIIDDTVAQGSAPFAATVAARQPAASAVPKVSLDVYAAW